MNPLHLFPTAGFDRSTTTPVLIGVLVSWFFTETFGWVFAGLVVPGYLAAVFAIDPRAGMVDVAEAIFTYGLARGIGEHLPRTGLTSRVFGRERFLLIVLSSIVVRLAVEGAILPRFAPHAAGSFFSIGLVVVPLAANACWKTGLGRGIVQTGVPTVIVFLLLKFVLLPHTNLSLAGFELATEDVASSFLDSPKAYILLITGAILAAAANVLDGWDFNGILIPALLSLVVLEPVKFGATFVEALVIVAIAAALLKTTRLGRANIEGPRRLVLFFSIDYAMRFLFAAFVGKGMPGADVVGLMGFGYLLPTLLAVKIAQRGNAPLVLLPTAQVSVGAFALGTLIGFSAAMVDTAPSAARTAIERPIPRAPNDPEAAGLWVAALARTNPHPGKGPAPMASADLVKLVDSALVQGGETDMTKLETAHLSVQRLDKNVVLFREKFQALEDRWGDPAILATVAGRAPGRRVVLLVPTPVSAPETAALAGRLVAEGRVDAVVLAGLESNENSPFVRASLDAARSLAGHGSDKGVVIALRRSPDGNSRVVLGGDGFGAARVDALLLSLEGKVGALPRKTGNAGDQLDVAIELPDSSIAQLFPVESKQISISSPAAMATVLDDIRTSTNPSSVEDLLVLRRLVLEPLLASPSAVAGAKRSLPLMRLAASKLGYALHGPSTMGTGEEALVLIGAEPRPIAIVAREKGVAGTLIEVPHGYQDGLRDVAVRMSTALSADAILFGLEHGGGARGGDALRLAHAIASGEIDGRKPRLVVLRSSLSSGDGAIPGASVAIGTWGGSARDELSASVKKAFASMGLTTADGTLDPSVRELSGRAVFGDTPVVAASIDPGAIRNVSLDEARGGSRVLITAGLPTYDGSLADVAGKLATSIPAGASATTVDVIDLARRTTIEQSVVARRNLENATKSSAARVGLVRSKSGDFVLVVARDNKGLIAGATSIDPRVKVNDAAPTTVKTLRECAAVLEAAGTCRAEAL